MWLRLDIFKNVIKIKTNFEIVMEMRFFVNWESLREKYILLFKK